ncbi:MAG: YlbF family regulator [Candidatus Methylacidiphilales bacterium]|nr:YlbF family regulator [Candidatus Methylacidiphilales bacterium]
MIQPAIDEAAIRDKTRELCELIVNQPAFLELRKDVERFLVDEGAQTQYRHVTEKGRLLQSRQHAGQEISDEDFADFERQRTLLVQNPVALAFLEAQQSMNGIQDEVNKLISKTFELGRLPTEEELACDNQGGCGSGCGCKG